jgi:nucleoside-diphosphate-sugar epimerase
LRAPTVRQPRRLRDRRLRRQDEFLARLVDGDFDDDIAAVLHQGACSDTMETDGRYMMRNNYRYWSLFEWCQDNDVPLLYASSASVYGGRGLFREERRGSPAQHLRLLEVLFDQHVRRALPERTAQVAGFRYFNVYGPREQQKGRMASVVFHFFHQYRAEGCVRLFEGSGGYAAGEQRRDFVCVDDVVKVNLDSSIIPSAAGSSISAAAMRRRSTTSPRRRSMRSAAPTARRRSRCWISSPREPLPTYRFQARSPASTRATRRRT